MRAGRMDPRGLGLAELAWSRGIDALVLSIPWCLLGGLAVVLLLC